MYRPESVHYILPADASQKARDAFSAAIATYRGHGLRTPMDLVPSATGANIQVRVTPGLVCGTDQAKSAACTSLEALSSGWITRGIMEFAFTSFMEDKDLVLYESSRAFGTSGFIPMPGYFFSNPSVGDGLTPDEIRMLVARESVPLLAVFIDK
ncbi:MAG: hypothetical protein WCP17_02740 [bacterium]